MRRTLAGSLLAARALPGLFIYFPGEGVSVKDDSRPAVSAWASLSPVAQQDTEASIARLLPVLRAMN